jgi:RNA polymerase sigma-70 factor, ECF subfamily
MGAERLTSDTPAAEEARAAAERAARSSYGRLVALLAAPTGDLELAEDALADAFERALRTWPDRGVPDRPDAWLLTVARNRQRDVWKSAAHRTAVPWDASVEHRATTDPVDALDPDALGDKRLELLLVCAHPAIAPSVRTPLMLQTALGFDAAAIAAAFAVPAPAMAQRLVRAKRRIRIARIPFVVPGRGDLETRLPSLLEAVYGCFALGWDDDARVPGSMAGEARHLAVTLARLLGDEPEAWGLAALVTLSLARAPARGPDYVPLDEQDPGLWDAGLIEEGEAHLRRAAHEGAPGRFELEAAIQAVHCDRARTGRTDWEALETLYSALLVVAPSLGARVARAAVLGRTQGAAAALAELGTLAGDPASAAAVDRFQPFHAARGDLLARAGCPAEAAASFARAADLSSPGPERDHLQRRAREAASPRARSGALHPAPPERPARPAGTLPSG